MNSQFHNPLPQTLAHLQPASQISSVVSPSPTNPTSEFNQGLMCGFFAGSLPFFLLVAGLGIVKYQRHCKRWQAQQQKLKIELLERCLKVNSH